jgi:hypothetical protein
VTAACARCTSPLEDGDLRCAICALPVVEAAAPVPERPRARLVRCTECNAAVAFSPLANAPRCGFCSAITEIEQPADPPEVAAYKAPFLVDRGAAAAAVQGWLSAHGWLAPRALRDEAVIESLVPLHWAAWVVDARALVTWTADSDASAGRSRWAPHAGELELKFDEIIVPASRGLSPRECARLAPHYKLWYRDDVDDDDGVAVESFEVQRSAARAAVQRAIEATARTRVEHAIPGRRFRNVSVSCLTVAQTTRRMALPAWVLAYRYRGTAYRAIVHGQRRDLVFGAAPIDVWQLVKLAAVALAVIALVAALAACSSTPVPPDAEDFFDRCAPAEPFAPLTGRAAVQGTLNVHVDAGGLIEVDTTTKLLFAMDLAQDGTDLAVAATLCRVLIPNIPLAGQELPIAFDVPDATIASVPTVRGSAALSSPDQSCAQLDSQPITLVIGARLEPAALATAPLPAVDATGTTFPACAPSAAALCADATGIDCACDQEGDGQPGLTLLAHNVPAVDLEGVFVTLRTQFSLHGRVHTSDLAKGRIDASIETAVLGCSLIGGAPCTDINVRTVQTLNPVITAAADNPSTFRSVRIPDTMTCAEIIAGEGMLFPR